MGVQINGATGNVIATKGTFSGNVGIAGTLTYEDVTDIDAVGLITARSGIEVGASPGVGASISAKGNAIFSGITTIGSKEVGTGITLSPDGHISVSGVTTSSTIHIGVDTGVYGEDLVVTGNSRVTGIASFGTSDNPAMHLNVGMSTLSAAPVLTVPDMIKHSGDPETRVRFDTGIVKVETTQIERFRIGPSGQIGLNGANYGTSGQALISQGSSAAPQWSSAGKVVALAFASSTTNEQTPSGADTWTLVGPQITHTAASTSNKLVFLHTHHLMIEGSMHWRMALWRDGTSGTNVYQMKTYTQLSANWSAVKGIQNVTTTAPDTSSHTYQFAIYRSTGSDSLLRYSPNSESTGSQITMLEIQP